MPGSPAKRDQPLTPADKTNTGGTRPYGWPVCGSLLRDRRSSDQGLWSLGRRCRVLRAALEAELFQGGEPGLGVGGELGDLVQQDADGDLGADRQGSLVDPFAGQRGDGPRAGQDAPVAVGEQSEGSPRVAFVGPWPGDGVGEGDLGGGGGDATGGGLGGG